MKVLMLINRFPPDQLGGYELRFSELAACLTGRDHEVRVLTACIEPGRVDHGMGWVHRDLTLQGEVHGLRGILRLARASLGDGRRMARVLRGFRPDVVLVGNVSGLSSALWNVLRASRAPLVLDVSNEWLLDLCTTHGNWFRIWDKPSRSRWRGAAKVLIGALLSTGTRVLRTRFPGLGAAAVYTTGAHVAERLRNACGADLPQVRVFGSGIQVDGFEYRPTRRGLTRLLYVGRLKRLKGVLTAVRALEALPRETTLTIVGVPDDPEYAQEVQRLAEEVAPGRIDFREPVPRSGLVSVFHSHDALLFPSECEEAFSRLVLEAMASGLPVIATPNGGTSEVIRDAENGLLHPAGDHGALAAAVLRLRGDPALRQRMVECARRTVEESYGFERFADRVESLLREVAG